ncbi:MAG: SGNH hydrolase domain-containing protein, partial [Ornithinimicrobium sp.]
LTVPSNTGGGQADEASPGAASISSYPESEGGASSQQIPGSVESLKNIEWFVPAATEATADIPQRPEDENCQVNQVSAEPVRCEYGDVRGETTIVLVGDSKVVQWQSALEEIADDQGWHMISYTKSACAFSSGMQVASGKPYRSCAEWNEKVLDTVIDIQPDLVLTTNRVNEVMARPHDTGSRTKAAMVDAVSETWMDLKEAGIPVVSLLDNPSPGISVYECVAENMDDLAACTFDRDTGIDASSAPGHLEAAERVPGTRTVDLRESICPEPTCVPVIGNVLVYRQTSHITNTYVMTLRPVLAEELVPVVQALASR